MKASPGLLITVLSIFIIGCNDGDNGKVSPVEIPSTPSISYHITTSYPHDTSYFTQGLEFYQNTLLEGTGLNGKSRLLKLEPTTGKVIQEIKLDDKYFGEGITVLNDTIYQLTYKENVVFAYAAADFKKLAEFKMTGEGWGLTNNGKELIATNGSSDLLFFQPSTFRLLRTQTVTQNGEFVPNLNELEYVNGFVYANQWQSNYIYKIDPNDGKVVARLDFTPTAQKEKAVNRHAEYMNGIAYNPTTKKFFITGKNWSQIYEVQFDH